MKLNPESRTSRWFFWSLGIIEKFQGYWGGYLQEEYERRTNLCHFMRTILIVAPGIIIMEVSLFLAFIAIAFVAPCYMYGTSTGLIRTGYFSGALVLLVALFIGIAFLNELRREHFGARPSKKKESGFFFLAGNWIKAQKTKICPFVWFERS